MFRQPEMPAIIDRLWPSALVHVPPTETVNATSDIAPNSLARDAVFRILLRFTPDAHDCWLAVNSTAGPGPEHPLICRTSARGTWDADG
jgi:hypothetical protein